MVLRITLVKRSKQHYDVVQCRDIASDDGRAARGNRRAADDYDDSLRLLNMTTMVGSQHHHRDADVEDQLTMSS